MRQALGTFVTAVVFGFVLSRVGFASWDQVHAMLTLTDLRLLLTFGAAVVVLFVAWRVIKAVSNPVWRTSSVHPGSFVGGMAFGIGWAFTGACPATAWVQLGEGKLAAALTVVGIFLGNALYGVVHERYLRWSSGSCVSE